MTATFELYCPPMKIFDEGAKLKRTAVEPMKVTITFPDGQVLILTATIPPTEVRKKHLLHWVVDACKGFGTDGRSTILVELPEEPTVFKLLLLTMVALAIDCPTTLTTPDGTWKGITRLPDCPIDIYKNPMEATEFTVKGTLELAA